MTGATPLPWRKRSTTTTADGRTVEHQEATSGYATAHLYIGEVRPVGDSAGYTMTAGTGYGVNVTPASGNVDDTTEAMREAARGARRMAADLLALAGAIEKGLE